MRLTPQLSFVLMAILVLLSASPVLAVSPNIVISQIYGAGGNTGATLRNDYVELFNRGTTTFSLTGWSVQYASATGSGNFSSNPIATLSGSLAPGQYYLIRMDPAGANGAALPTPDATSTIAMAAGAGKVALVNTTTGLACNGSSGQPCNSAQLAQIVDLVGYGNANFFEGAATAPTISATTADFRAAAGCTDTDNNSADFAAAAPAPRNSASPFNPCSVPNLSINDVSLNEGNAGTTTFSFTVSLSSPAGPGGVSFNISTADGTAQDDNPVTEDNDYVAKSLTAQTIPASSSTYTFDVLVNGDTSPETNETFFVNVTSPSGATITDGVGQGTIVNDDVAANLTIDDVSLNEGNGGTTTFTFTVSLSAPAPAGGVTFDIGTQDNTAVAPGDYTTKTLTGQTISAGSSTYTFDVLVNGDTAPEPDETFFVNVTNVTNAIPTDGQGQGTIVNDDLFRIHDVQGNGAATPIPGATVSVEGVVTANFQGSGKLQGFFLQEEDADADADPATSEGIFVFCSSCPTAVTEGWRVRATGSVSEFNNMTEITASTAGSVVVTDTGNNLAAVTPAPIDLPVVGDVNTFYEMREGMLVTFVDTLTVSEYFDLARFGHIRLFEGGRPRQFTEASPPSVAGYAAHLDNLDRRRVILDDDNNRQNAYLPAFGGPPDGSQFVFHPRANGGFSVGTQGIDFFRGGDQVVGLTGVLHWSFPGVAPDTWRIRPTLATPATFTVANPRPATPPVVGGAIKAAGMNLLNYFTTLDTGGTPCGPAANQECRGANSTAELNRQRERAAIVICGLNADVFAFMELENTATSTITDLVGAVNVRCGGANPYAFVNTGGTLGTDAIRVELIYRSNTLSPVGPPLVDLDPIHNRPPTAQTFDVIDPANPAFGERFTVIANHFKSKGCPGTGADADAGDGASCFNGTRTSQASRLLTWISSTVLPAAGDPDVLLLGDFNSYPQETPVTTLTGGGFTDLETAILGPAAYSYLFDGQLGHLDYAFSSTSLTPQVTGVGPWHINADEVPLFDYNDEVFDNPGESNFDEKPDGSSLSPPRVVFQPALPSPYRASDHDPVLVGLFQVADLSITKVEGADPVTAGTNLSYTITVTNDGPDAAANAAWSDTLPAGTTFVSLSSVAGWSCNTPAVGTGGLVSCSNPSFAVGSAVFTLTVAVDPGVAAGTVLSNTANATSDTGDPDSDDLSATETTTVDTAADLSTTKVDDVDPVVAGANLTYTITVTNAGPSDAASVSLSDTLPAGTTFVSLASPGGWSCNTPAVGTGGTVSCSIASLGLGSSVFTLTVAVDFGVPSGTVITNTAMASSANEANSGDENGSADTTVSPRGDYFTVTPCRAVDTRSGAPLQNGVPEAFALHGVCGIPTTATTVVLNVTVVGATGSGDLTLYASDATPPGFSTMPFPAGKTRSLFVVGAISADAAGELAVLPSVAGNGTVHVLIDIMGYFE